MYLKLGKSGKKNMNYKVIIFNNAEEIEKALNEAYKEGYETGYDDCFNEADDFFSAEDVEAKEELRKQHEAELDKVGHEAYEEGKKVGYEDGYQEGYKIAKNVYGGLTTSGVADAIPCTLTNSSEGKCTDAVSHINL